MPASAKRKSAKVGTGTGTGALGAGKRTDSATTPALQRTLDREYRYERLVSAQHKVPVRRGFFARLFGFLLRLGVVYLFAMAIAVCPRGGEGAVCSALGVAQRGLAPLAPAFASLDHALAPYQARATELYDARLRTHVDTAVARARPVAAFIARDVAAPALAAAEHAGTVLRAHPAIQRARSAAHEAAAPHIAAARDAYTHVVVPNAEWYAGRAAAVYTADVKPRLAPLITRLREWLTPLLAAAHAHGTDVVKVHAPAARRYVHETALPAARVAAQRTHDEYFASVHPHVVHLCQQVKHLVVDNVFPSLNTFYNVYVRPQIGKISERIQQYKSAVESEAAAKASASSSSVAALKAMSSSSSSSSSSISVRQAAAAAAAASATATGAELPKADGKRMQLMDLQNDYKRRIAETGLSSKNGLIKKLVQSRFNNSLPLFANGTPVLREDLVAQANAWCNALKAEKTAVLSKGGPVNEKWLASFTEKIERTSAKLLAEIDALEAGQKAIEADILASYTAKLDDVLARAQEVLGLGWSWFHGDGEDAKYNDDKYIDHAWRDFHLLDVAVLRWKQYLEKLADGRMLDPRLQDDPVDTDRDESVERFLRSAKTFVANCIQDVAEISPAIAPTDVFPVDATSSVVDPTIGSVTIESFVAEAEETEADSYGAATSNVLENAYATPRMTENTFGAATSSVTDVSPGPTVPVSVSSDEPVVAEETAAGVAADVTTDDTTAIPDATQPPATTVVEVTTCETPAPQV